MRVINWWGQPCLLAMSKNICVSFLDVFACFCLLKLSFRESKGWLPEGENTLCFKSNNAPAAAAESNDAATSAAA